MSVDFAVREQQGIDYFTEGSFIVDLYFNQKWLFKSLNNLMVDLFLTNMQLFASRWTMKSNLLVDYSNVFYQLELNVSKWRNKLILDGLRVSKVTFLGELFI